MKLLAHFYEGKCTCYFRACKSIPRKRKNFKRLYIFFKKLLILLSGLQAQIHSRFDVLDPWVTSMHRVISIQWEQTISNRDFLLVLPLIRYSVVFPEAGRSMVREAERYACSLWRYWLPWPSGPLLCCGCCRPAELTEPPALVIQRKVKQFSLNSPSLAIWTKSSVFTKTGDKYAYLVKTAFLWRLKCQAE